MQPELRDQAKDRWPSIYSHYGFDKSFLSKRNIPCPNCGGKDRFRFCDYGRGVVICNQCNPSGMDGIDFLMQHTGLTFADMANEIRQVVGTAQASKQDDTNEMNRHRAALTSAWNNSRPVTDGDPVDQYFQRRNIPTPKSTNIRYHPTLSYYDGDKKTSHHAMLALIRTQQGDKATIHRTYLTKDGEKAKVPSPKKIMSPAKKWTGGVIDISEGDGDTIVIAEGIETTRAYMEIAKIKKGWAAVSANNMLKVNPPDGLSVVIAGDNDQSYTGQKAAFTLAHRLKSDGFNVWVDIPQCVGDWADGGHDLEQSA